ncbi:MAG: glycosylhydrolase-like jelly roll fold domain-containing protein [Phycisphaerae bacterium]
MTGLAPIISHQKITGYIYPLFWQHGEPSDRILEEIDQMHANGIGGFILESRPHPDFLGESWWSNLRFILTEAAKRRMKVWVFDDSKFPSGFGAGRIRDLYPQYLKVYLREQHIDAAGPMESASFQLKGWINPEDQLVRVVVARRTDGVDKLDADTLIDVTDKVIDGVLYWDIPDGYWRVFIFVRTRNGGEDATRDYLNPLDPAAVRAFIDTVYEPHYAHFADEFGKTFAGFFSDEPRFGNHPTYEATLGKCPMVLPYCDTLLTDLSEAWNGAFGTMLPCLWYDAGKLTAKVRYIYMDTVTKLYAVNFTEQIGNWCRDHNVKLIGHVVEDNGAHSRLGYGTGHFFRALRGQDFSGLDVVSQVWPDYSSGRLTSPFGYLDAEFFYWGITKMAASEGHLDPKKQGTTVCEIFGAYGWQEGLKLMKWLTDHVCVRGVNFLIPHAFSPKQFPDPDCPPHFYAGGHNPQWRYFKYWSSYANRICHLLSGGRHMAPVAVVYHAEAEWAGEYEPFEKVVKTLAQRQIDCDVVPIDTLVSSKDTVIRGGGITINQETYRAVIIPYAQVLSEVFLERLDEMAKNGVRIVFMGDYPSRGHRLDLSFSQLLSNLKAHCGVSLSSHDHLVDDLRRSNIYDLSITGVENHLRSYGYSRLDETVYFFTNESKVDLIDTMVDLKHAGHPIGYDALNDIFYDLSYITREGQTRVRLRLEPYETLFVIFPKQNVAGLETLGKKEFILDLIPELSIEGSWMVSRATAEDYPDFTPETRISGLGNISASYLLPSFSGTLRYELTFEYPASSGRGRKFLDLGRVFEIAEVKINGREVGVRICPPYRVEVTDYLQGGANTLQVDVTNTLSKQYGMNVFDRAMPQEPSGMLGPVRLLSQPNIIIGNDLV